MKKILLTIDQPPSEIVSEKLRMAVGLTMDDDNAISLLMIGAGVFNAVGVDEEAMGWHIDKHLSMLQMMKVGIYVDADSITARNINPVKFGVQTVTTDNRDSIIDDMDLIIS